jgi:chitosanase
MPAPASARASPWLQRVEQRDTTLDHELRLHNLLRATADDPVMREMQDQFFDEGYWQPAARIAAAMGIATPLGLAVVYDSLIQGSWKTVRDLTITRAGRLAELGERAWIGAYVATRHAWLAGHRRSDLRATAYRMEAFQRLAEQAYWGLELPLVVRGAELSPATLYATPPGCYDGPQPGTRAIALQTPLARGLDVRLLQLALSERGIAIKADGIFGRTSANLLRDYQLSAGLPATGVADPALIGQLVT